MSAKKKFSIFSQRLAQAREEKKLSQKEFGELINVGQVSSISRYETLDGDMPCKGLPDLARAYDIAKALNVSLDWLVGLSDVRTLGSTKKKDKTIEEEIEVETNLLLAAIKGDSQLFKFDGSRLTLVPKTEIENDMNELAKKLIKSCGLSEELQDICGDGSLLYDMQQQIVQAFTDKALTILWEQGEPK